jgi:hypothetical protein
LAPAVEWNAVRFGADDNTGFATDALAQINNHSPTCHYVPSRITINLRVPENPKQSNLRKDEKFLSFANVLSLSTQRVMP